MLGTRLCMAYPERLSQLTAVNNSTVGCPLVVWTQEQSQAGVE